MSKIRLAIVDDHQIVIDGLLSLLRGKESYQVAFTTNHPEEAIGLLSRQKVDVLLTDVMMPVMTGPQLAKAVKEQYPHIRIIALSMNGEGDVVDEMIRDADICGYALKNIGQAELLRAIDKCAGGGNYFSDEVLAELERTANRKKENEETHLTQREIEILRMMESERTNKQIADELFISERTVETHRKNIFRKTGASSLVGLIKYAYAHKLL